MTQHSTAFEVERPVPAGDALENLLQDKNTAGVSEAARIAPVKKFNFRKLLMAGAAAAVLAGAAWYGLGLLDRRAVSGFDRRRLCESRQHHRRAESLGLSAVRCWSATTSASRPARCWRGSTSAISRCALDQAKADVAAARAAIASKQAQLGVQQAVIDAAKATIDVDKAAPTFAAQENKRYSDLAATGYGSVQNAQQAQSRIAGAQAAIAARYRQPCLRTEAGRPAQGRDRSGRRGAGARKRRAGPGRTQSRLHLDHQRRSTASSATERCAPASSCRPARN